MKLNFKFYKYDIEYNKLKNENELINNYILKLPEEKYEEVFSYDNCMENLNALSEMRKNIINWYPFDMNSNVLEIGAGLRRNNR